MTPQGTRRLLSGACVSGLASLGLMVWSLFDPRPIPVVAAMSVGQVLGTLSLGWFLFAVRSDVRMQMRRAPESGASRSSDTRSPSP